MKRGTIGKYTLAASFVASVFIACGGGMGGFGGAGMGNMVGNLACPELQGGASNADFEADAKANATIRAFVTAAGDLAAVATKVEAEVGAACEAMGRDLGIPADQMVPRSNEGHVAAACNAVSAKMDTILKTGVSASVKADYTPPQCQVSADAEASCKGQCQAHVDPGYVRAHCQPGHLYGRCDGACSGQCSATCNGECQGQCEGKAAAKVQSGAAAGGGSGQCAGHCNGTCRGTCSEDCHGSCNVDFKEPKCDVAIAAPSADAHCEGSCKVHADLTAQCTEPRVKVAASVNSGEMGKLVATLDANLPALIKAELTYGKRIAGDIDMLVRTGSELPSAFGQLTGHAAACVAAAANACVSAQASLRVSVRVSASVSAKAGVAG
ncbi:MAG: hypothetical protein M3O46_03365 [Myxococcota bacterium]|nr:hypothetical protein [Myxococcota bacterium]